MFTVDVVEDAEGLEHLNEGEAVLEASFFDERCAEHHDNGTDLVQQHSAKWRIRRIHHFCSPLKLGEDDDDDDPLNSGSMTSLSHSPGRRGSG